MLCIRSNLISVLALIIHELLLGDIKEVENQPMLKNFNLNLILTWTLFKIT